MADERDFELLDDYFTNRLSGEDRSAFEQKLQADPDLQHEYALQERLVQGIRDARVAELKSMLNNVAIPASNPGNSLATKLILGTVISLIIAGAGYWYFSAEDVQVPAPHPTVSQDQQQVEEPALSKPEETHSQEQALQADQEPKVDADKNQTSAGTEHSKPSLARRPAPLAAPGPTKADRNAAGEGPVLNSADPAEKESSSNAKNGNPTAVGPAASLRVETDRNNQRYAFHYQFQPGKLLLFGPFEKNHYKIMEFFADGKRTIYLWHNDRYYRLNDASRDVRPLEPISDPALLKKLRDYRSAQ